MRLTTLMIFVVFPALDVPAPPVPGNDCRPTPKPGAAFVVVVRPLSPLNPARLLTRPVVARS
jgi:hypothetical protein